MDVIPSSYPGIFFSISVLFVVPCMIMLEIIRLQEKDNFPHFHYGLLVNDIGILTRCSEFIIRALLPQLLLHGVLQDCPTSFCLHDLVAQSDGFLIAYRSKRGISFDWVSKGVEFSHRCSTFFKNHN